MISYNRFLKPFLDFLIGLLLGFVLLPVGLLIYLLLLAFQKGNPLFIQERPGFNEKTFNLIKFRTMSDEMDSNGKLLPDAKRLNGLGRILRKFSLDEIPQLLNVIKGDMSIVGPRPLFVKYLPYYWFEERLRHSVKPGITGLAQVSGRNNLGWDNRLALDVQYVNTQSFLTDVKILLQTVINVIKSKDVNVDPSSIMLDLDQERKNFSGAEKFRWFLIRSMLAHNGVDFGITDLSKWVDKVIANANWKVVELETDIVSYVAYYENDAKYFITMVWTSYLHRGKGYARRLLKEIIEDHGNKPVDLVVAESNPALSLYQSLGFEELDRVEGKITMRYI